MSDDEIDFSDEAMFGASKPRPPPLAPVTRPTPPPVPAGVMVPRCPQCGFAYGIASHTRIVRRNRRDEEMTFCSVACGGDFQMGCEG